MSAMNRRSALGLGAGALLTGPAFAANATTGHETHHKAAAASTGPKPWETHADLIKVLNHCVATSEACLQHCLDAMNMGDNSLYECSQRVRETKALCEATRTLANAGSLHFEAIAAVCNDSCKSCRSECEKHAGHHAICGTCADSCEDVIKQLEG
ncbi:hypothetical protein JCM17844_22950 [Iodidimonas gelatinilytica]|uniref:Four-helix bundle copper-binding protein n=1 Tax=Iodidimonas gelatinilytica TaxID=1236966 RepID=A0A5A7N154_9PROT|nr:Csp1 family four helix bundle copper storage protein [Iodidimonas gelatinilytica]GEQ98658.1 hypothetical protein JCM17844_22950 [Iodidimonas gelatinilytica]GER01858.1 hypothetical protein JCM17845_24810 [Iodidimonas gelatinilytica]